MGIFGFGKSSDKKTESNASSTVWKPKNIFQVIGFRNVFCEQLYTCVGNHSNFHPTSPTWSDSSGYTHKPVEQVRDDIIQSLKEYESKQVDPIFAQGKVEVLTDSEMHFYFPDKEKKMHKLSLEKYLSDYSKLLKLSRSRHLAIEEIRNTLSTEFGYDVEYAFAWKSRLIK